MVEGNQGKGPGKKKQNISLDTTTLTKQIHLSKRQFRQTQVRCCATHIPLSPHTASHADPFSPMLIQINSAVAAPTTRIVRMAAPALSPAVTGFGVGLKSSDLLPAFGLPWLVPPVSALTGPAVLLMSKDERAPRTFICCPAPMLLSKVRFFQSNPHCRPRAPPVQVVMAASVDNRSTGSTLSVMNGATLVAVAYQRCR